MPGAPAVEEASGSRRGSVAIDGELAVAPPIATGSGGDDLAVGVRRRPTSGPRSTLRSRARAPAAGLRSRVAARPVSRAVFVARRASRARRGCCRRAAWLSTWRDCSMSKWTSPAARPAMRSGTTKATVGRPRDRRDERCASPRRRPRPRRALAKSPRSAAGKTAPARARTPAARPARVVDARRGDRHHRRPLEGGERQARRRRRRAPREPPRAAGRARDERLTAGLTSIWQAAVVIWRCCPQDPSDLGADGGLRARGPALSRRSLDGFGGDEHRHGGE